MAKPAQATPVEGWRANVPLFRAIATASSILLSVAWLSWQGSQWVSEIRSEMRELRTTLVAINKAVDSKAATTELMSAVKDFEHRFALMCARAPIQQKPWVCGEAARLGKG